MRKKKTKSNFLFCFMVLVASVAVINSLYFVARTWGWSRKNVRSQESKVEATLQEVIDKTNQEQASNEFHAPKYPLIEENIPSSPNFHAVTYASHRGSDERFCMALESAARHKIRLTILGWGIPWRGLFQKLEAAMELAENLPSDDVVLFVDAFDVLFTNTSSQV